MHRRIEAALLIIALAFIVGACWWWVLIMIWIPEHERGESDIGQIKKDYEV